MNTLFNVILVILAAVFAFRVHVLLGIAFIMLAGLYIYNANYPKLMAGRANAEFSKGNTKLALNYYQKAISKKKPTVSLLSGYSMMLLRCGQPNEALTQINKALSVSHLPKDLKWQAKQIRSLVNYKLGILDEAYEEALEIYDEGFTTSVMRAVLGLIMTSAEKDDNKVLSFCEDAYDYDSDSRDIVDNYFVSLLRTKNYDKAKEISDKLLSEQPTFVEGFYHSALLYKALGNTKKAKELSDKISECKFSFMTTVSKQDVEDLKNSL